MRMRDFFLFFPLLLASVGLPVPALGQDSQMYRNLLCAEESRKVSQKLGNAVTDADLPCLNALDCHKNRAQTGRNRLAAQKPMLSKGWTQTTASQWSVSITPMREKGTLNKNKHHHARRHAALCDDLYPKLE